MRCSHCDLPLSPANKSGTCPRCSAPIGSKPLSNAVQAPTPWPPAQENQNYEWGTGTGLGLGQPQQQGEVQFTGLPGRPVGPAGVGDTPSPAPLFQSLEQPQNQVRFPAQISLQTPAQNFIPGMQTLVPASTPTPAWISPLSEQTQAGNYTNKAVRSRRNGQLGFTIAGLCIITGALLLIFVYVISIELSQNAASNDLTTPALAQPTNTAHVKPTAAASPTTSPSTPATFPGQQYISNAQMASVINKNTAQPVQTATAFPVGSPVYVTFIVHPNGQPGEVCLSWYLNGKFTSNFSFAVNSASTTAYSYTYYHASGQAYVDLSWSNSADCSNAVLAQHVDFTIEG